MSISFKVKLVIENFLSYEIREPCFGDIHRFHMIFAPQFQVCQNRMKSDYYYYQQMGSQKLQFEVSSIKGFELQLFDADLGACKQDRDVSLFRVSRNRTRNIFCFFKIEMFKHILCHWEQSNREGDLHDTGKTKE